MACIVFSLNLNENKNNIKKKVQALNMICDSSFVVIVLCLFSISFSFVVVALLGLDGDAFLQLQK